MRVTDVATVKVATVVSDTQLAFNAGRELGIEEGDTVTLNREVEIKDPDSGERLGSVVLPKLRLKVTLVSLKFCVAKVSDRLEVKGGSGLSAIGRVGSLMTVTTDAFDDSPGAVFVQLGELARIRRPLPDEPPF